MGTVSKRVVALTEKADCPDLLHVNGTTPSSLETALSVLVVLSVHFTKWLKREGASP